VLAALALCVAAAVGYNAGVVLQSSGAYGSGEHRIMHPSLFLHLVRVPSWVSGVALNLVGWVFQVWALTLASLTFVQPALGTGMILLLAFAWLVLGRRPTARDGAAALAFAAGIALLSRFAPRAHHGTRHVAAWVAAGAVISVVAVAPLVLRAVRRVPGHLVLSACVGFAYAITGLSSEVVSRGIDARRPEIILGGVLVTAAFGLVGFLTETSALVTGGVTQVVAVVVAVDTVLPVGLAPFLFGEHWPRTPAHLAALAAGIVLSIGAAVVLATSPAVTQTLPATGAIETR
jgi:hypothetical protein